MSAQEPHGGGFDASCGVPPIAFTAKDYAADAGHVAPTLRAMPHAASHANGGGQVAICVQEGRVDARKMKRMAVRRLLPVECERLLGMPDDYTLIPYRGNPAADGPRYRAIGNSMAVPVMRWIGRRIQMVDSIRG
jgi:DNA (cytosine-5)-methyltransferase 1